MAFFALASFFILGLAACGKSVASYVEQADELVSKGKIDEAIVVYQRGIQEFPKNPNLYINQAALLRSKGLLPKAFKYYEVAHQLNQDSVLPVIGMGRVYFRLKDYDNARKIFDKVLENAKDDPTALFYLGRIHYELKDGNQALTYFNQAFDAKFDTLEIYYHRGLNYEKLLRNIPLAIADYELYIKGQGKKLAEVQAWRDALAKAPSGPKSNFDF